MIDVGTRCTALLLLITLAGCSREVDEPLLTYEGASTISETVLPELIAGYERTSGRRFGAVGTRGSSVGITEVLAGHAAVGGISRPLKPSEKAQGLYYEIIGYDAMAVFVHRTHLLRNLTQQQLKSVFTGQIKNWKELGDPDAPIELVIQRKGEIHGTARFFRDSLLDSEPVAPSAVAFDEIADCVKYVASHPNAVTYASPAYAQEGVAELSLDGIPLSLETIVSAEYPITRPLLLISRGIPEGQTKLFYDFVHSPEGRKVLARSFYPLTRGP